MLWCHCGSYDLTAKRSSTNKTQPGPASVSAFIDAIEHPVRRQDARVLQGWFGEVTGYRAVMWGESIVGYGRYHYQYKSGRSGDFLITGFSPRKSSLSLYIMPGYQDLEPFLQRLGKHKIGKSCLYINKLADIDMAVLSEIVLHGVDYMKRNYDTFER